MRLVLSGDPFWHAVLDDPRQAEADTNLLQRMLRLGEDPEWWKR